MYFFFFLRKLILSTISLNKLCLFSLQFPPKLELLLLQYYTFSDSLKKFCCLRVPSQIV